MGLPTWSDKLLQEVIRLILDAYFEPSFSDLRRRMDSPLNDTPSPYWDARTEIVQRLLADTCELCGSHTAVEVHHIRALRDLKHYGRAEKPAWVKTMAARHRKTLVVCRSCHKDIHHGRPLKAMPQLE